MTGAMDRMVSDARRWLLHSGIRGDGQPDDGFGGAIRRAYDAGRQHYELPYPEVTAYALQFHLRLATDRKDAADLSAAVASGQWLLGVQERGKLAPGAFPYAVQDGAATGGWYSFDTSVIAHALFEIGQETGDATFLDGAERAATWLLAQQQSDGSFRAFAGEARPVSWAGNGNCLHGKHAVLFSAFWQASGKKAYLEAAERLLTWLTTLQASDGGFRTAQGHDFVFAHSHCYAVEGLIAGALMLESESLVDAAVRGGRYLASLQTRAGGVRRYAGSGASAYLEEMRARIPWLRRRLVPEDVGATAQAARLWVWLQRHFGADFAEPAQRALRWLQQHQLHNRDSRLDGGFPAGIDRFAGLQRRELCLYPWVAVFAADAGRMWSTPDRVSPIY